MFAFLTKRILLQQLIYIRRFGCKAAATTSTTTTGGSRLVNFMTCNALNLTLKCNSIFQYYYYFTISFHKYQSLINIQVLVISYF